MLQPHSEIAFLERPAFRHTNYREYSQYLQPYLSEKARDNHIETICLIREPLSWLDSWYRFRARGELRDPHHPNHKNSTFGIQFSDFIEAYMLPDPPPFADVGSQFDFVKDHKGEVGVETIFQYENIGHFVEYMSHRIGVELTIKTMNVSPKANYRSNLRLWTNTISQKIKKKTNLLPVSSRPMVISALSEDLMRALRDFLSRDFELYASIVKHRPTE